MPHSGQEIHGRDGFRLLVLRTGDETDGQRLEMEATYPGSGEMPPEHLHPQQHERFDVLEGSIRVVVEGVERRYGPGEHFEIAAGTPHRMGADQPARVRWEVRPALRTAEFFEALHGGAFDPADPAAFLARYSDEIRFTGG